MSSLDDLRAALLARCPQWLYEVLPGGRMVGAYYHTAALSGGQGDSLKVNTRDGKWGEWSSANPITGGDLVSLYAAITSTTYKDAFHALADKLGIGIKRVKTSSGTAWVPIVPVPRESYSVNNEGAPILPQDVFGEYPSASWPYLDANGELLCFRVRFDREHGKKDFRPVTFCRNKDTGEFKWMVKDLPQPRPLYGLELLAAKPAKVLIVEGEKCADAARIALPRFCVITWPSGAKAAAQADWSPVRGLPPETEILEWPDHDAPGERAMTDVATLLERALLIVRADPRWADGWDIADLIASDWDTAALEAYIAQNAVPLAAMKQQERAVVDMGGADANPLGAMRSLAAGIAETNANIYVSAGGPVALVRTIFGHIELRHLDVQGFRDWAARALEIRFGKLSDNIISALLYHAVDYLPKLKAIAHTPVLAEGRLIETAGYDRSAQVYIELPSGYDAEMDIVEAWDLVDDVLVDFPFETPSDKSAALCYVLTAMCRQNIPGPTPLFRFEAPVPRTGKTLLCQVLSELITPCPRLATLSRDEEEVRKTITSSLLREPATVVFDNVESGLDSPALKSALTGTIWGDRILGASRDVALPIMTTWGVTLNNPILSLEMLGRSVRVRLNYPGDPTSRATWRHPHLLPYVRGARAKLLSAFAAMIRYGAELSPKHRFLAGFEEWAATVSRIAIGNEYADPLESAEEDMSSALEEDRHALVRLVELWAERFPDADIGILELSEMASEVGMEIKKDKFGAVDRRSFGRQLKKLRGNFISGWVIAGPTHTRVGEKYRLRHA